MQVLEALQRRAPIKFELETVTFDPGFSGFEADKIADFCDAQNWSHHTIKAPMEDIIREKEAEKRPCLLCSRLRRGMLYKKAEGLKCSKVALGHNLDDTAVSLMISTFRGGGITTMGPNVPADEADLRIIRPLAYAPEDLVTAAAAELELPVFGECAYKEQLDEHGDRAYFMALL
ncbi:MAG: tRNA 2-thiocytidine biosynthesis protein TtcA [Lentisphaerae bacterium]|nr:tRNA 2-thiocytidine biosynthesis protein TtcA [Lentisphaerota bacterium]MCP4102138.1 tRNA 2-thiocytidine biosynthesis protein TtcA [Lentisphaerota bacterium]